LLNLVAVSDNLRETADLLGEYGFNVIPMDMADTADALVFSPAEGKDWHENEDLQGINGVVAINGDIHNPEETLILLRNKAGLAD
jgi:hypothetical protein